MARCRLGEAEHLKLGRGAGAVRVGLRDAETRDDRVPRQIGVVNKKEAVALAVSVIAKKYNLEPRNVKTRETKYDDDAGDWYVALGWDEKKAIIKMDSVQGTITEISDI